MEVSKGDLDPKNIGSTPVTNQRLDFYSYVLVYSKYYANVENTTYGYLAMVLPVVTLFAKPISCSVTDANGTHRQLLIGSVVTYGLTYGAFAVIPYFKDPDDHDNDTLTWIVICILHIIGNAAASCLFCMQDALASNYARKNDLSYSRMRIWANVGWAFGALGIMIYGDLSWLPFRVPGCIILAVLCAADALILLYWPYQDDFEMFHDGSTVEQRKLSIVGPNTRALMAQRSSRGSISKDLLERIKAGRSKSVGMLPSAPVVKKAQDVPSKKKDDKEYTNFQIQMILMKMIVKEHKSFSKYILLFITFGIVQSMLWSFQFDYFKARITKTDDEFEFISTLCMIAQSVTGEILINAVASKLIAMFGANANMSLALITQGMRCYCYSSMMPYMSSYFVFFSEALQGPSLGLYWILIVDIGSNFALMVTDYIPELKRRGIVRNAAHEVEISGCLRASMIGFMSSSMEGLGVAIGAYVGGVVSSKLGYDIMWNMCAVISITVGFINIGWELLSKLILRRNSKKKEPSVADSYLTVPSIFVEASEISKGTRM